MLITISIAAILAFLAGPSMSESIQNSKLKELSGEFTAALYLAQSESVKRGVQVSMRPLRTVGNEWLTGWDVFADLNGNGSLDAGEEIVQTHRFSPNGLTLISNDSAFSSWLAFKPSGEAKGVGGISGGFRICRQDNDTTKSRSITIQASGNIIVEVGASSCPSS